ncbi:hypothetical protein BV25DRAFT_1593632 [Artomyces pyxidatus]|uniref:Uncharacterized protein n=1 Tax=Artomyces pyxidatus TaxID=48021 RepID=A0ACB8TB22_9AGAM|nr:hypothetical protein BV25DRAFT_1593632 [Artomyces pyxidatus]
MLAPAWLLRGITDFTVSGMVVLEELVLTLKNMPQLQILSVFLQGPTHSDIPEAVVADLPSLSLFKVGDYNPHSFWTLLSHLRMPATVRMRLLLTPIAAASWESWSDFLHAMNSLLLPRMRDTFRQVHIRGGPYDGHICAWTTALSEDSADATLRPPEAARFVFHVMWKESFLKPFSAQGRTFSSPFFHLPTLCFHLAVKEVTALTITQDLYHDAVPSSHWFSLLLHFSALESLTLHGSTPGLFAAISALLPAMPADQYPMVLPHLKKLTISSVKINSASMPEPGSDYFSSMKRTLARRIAKPERNDITDELMTFLWDRAPSRVACPLELVLLGCDVDVLAAKALRDCVGELRVTQDPHAPPEGLDQKARYILDSKCVDLDSPLTSMMFAT